MNGYLDPNDYFSGFGPTTCLGEQPPRDSMAYQPPSPHRNAPSFPSNTSNAENGIPMLVDEPTPMLPCGPFLLTTAPHENYSPENSGSLLSFNYGLFFAAAANSGTYVGAVADTTQQDPQNMLGSGYPDQQEHIQTAPSQAAMRGLANVGYGGPDCEALVQLLTINDDLARGNFRVWRSKLDRTRRWVKYAYSHPEKSGLSKSVSAQFAFGRAIWLDIIAAATGGDIPWNIGIYRKVLDPHTHLLLYCLNQTLSIMGNTVAIAACPNHIPSAKTNFDEFRDQLAGRWHYTLDVLSIKAAIHTAGVRLYVEITAHRGDVDHPDVQNALRALWRLVSLAEDEDRREVKFWIFLAGCHTPIKDICNDCYMWLQSILFQDGDAAVGAAMSGFLFPVTARALTVY
ncbi:hypothetical protein RhiJN_03402 [Ceratobasidium sp. AG-Ba]|nr:hypothetical protein RhiJN_03402 [Ceratobasidium sp. AG-Ba]